MLHTGGRTQARRTFDDLCKPLAGELRAAVRLEELQEVQRRRRDEEERVRAPPRRLSGDQRQHERGKEGKEEEDARSLDDGGKRGAKAARGGRGRWRGG